MHKRMLGTGLLRVFHCCCRRCPQADALLFVALRRKLSGKGRVPEDVGDAVRADMERVGRALAAQLPHSERAAQGIAALVAVRDNHVFTALAAALSPDADVQVCAVHVAGEDKQRNRPCMLQ